MGTVEPEDRYTCDDLDCVDVGIGVMHHPMCGEKVSDCFPPDTPEEEEMYPPDPARDNIRI